MEPLRGGNLPDEKREKFSPKIATGHFLA